MCVTTPLIRPSGQGHEMLTTAYQVSRFLRHLPTPQSFPFGLLSGLLPGSLGGRQVVEQVPGGGTGVPQILGNKVPEVDQRDQRSRREAPTRDHCQGERGRRTSSSGRSCPITQRRAASSGILVALVSDDFVVCTPESGSLIPSSELLRKVRHSLSHSFSGTWSDLIISTKNFG